MTSAATESPVDVARTRGLVSKCVTLALLVAIVIAICILGSPPTKISPPGVAMNLPPLVFSFKGEDQPISEGEKVLLPEDTEIVKKLYTDAAGESVSFQIVLSGADRRSIHRPEICLPGQGWKIRSGEVIPVPLKSGRTMPVMLLDITRQINASGGQKELTALYAYWFVSADAETPYHWARVAQTTLDLLFHNKSHRWAYVIASAPVMKGFKPGGRDREETLKLLKSFIREAVPSFQYSEMPPDKAATLKAPAASGT